ncbi:MAG: hypothetical protein ACTJHU_04145, partial [Mycetocola sp.]
MTTALTRPDRSLTGPTAALRIRTGAAQGSPAVLSIVAMIAIFVLAAIIQPGIVSINGINLMLVAAVPLVLATQAQALIMSVGDIDLGVGSLLGLVTVIAATVLGTSPLVGVLML